MEESRWYSPSNGCPCRKRAWSLASPSIAWMLLTRSNIFLDDIGRSTPWHKQNNMKNPPCTAAGIHVTQVLGTHLGLLASICQSTTRIQVMTRL